MENFILFKILAVIMILTVISLIISLITNLYLHNKEKKELEKEKNRIKNKKLSYNQILSHSYNLEQKNSQNISVYLTTILILSTIFFSYLSYNIQKNSLNTQIELANQNMEFLKQTSSTNWANVEIVFNSEVFVVDANRLILSTEEVYPLDFKIINSGKTNTGQVSVQGDSVIYAEIEQNNDLNISSQMGKESKIRIKQKGCEFKGDYFCDISKIPHEEYNLSLTLTCRFCQPEKSNIIVPLCIYHDGEERENCNEKY